MDAAEVIGISTIDDRGHQHDRTDRTLAAVRILAIARDLSRADRPVFEGARVGRGNRRSHERESSIGKSFAARNPQQRLPVLVLDDGRPLAQSLAILEYLEESRPKPSLWPEDRYQRALARQFALISIADSHPLIVPRIRHRLAETFGADEAAIEAWGRHWMDQGLRAMEALLARPERPQGAFCYGDAPTIADIALASHCAGAGYFNCPLDPYAGVRSDPRALHGAAGVQRDPPARGQGGNEPGRFVTPGA